MRAFLYLAFFFVGALFGSALSGFGAAVLGGILGLVVFKLIDGSHRAALAREGDPRSSGAEGLRREMEALRREVAQLHRRLDALTGETAIPAEAAPGPVEWEPAPASMPASSAMTGEEWPAVAEPPMPESPPALDIPVPQPVMEWEVEPPATESAPTDRFNPIEALKNWLFGGNALVRVGVVVLFFGLAFLVKFAAEHAVIPIEFRYIGIGAGALAMLSLGWRLRTRRPEYAMALQGLGVAILYLVTFAAFRLHALLPASVTMFILVATCALSAALAILQNARSMAVIGICGGFLAPVLASTGAGSHVALFSYYAVLNAGIVAIAWFKAWRPLNVLGFVLTFGIGSLWGSRNYRDELFASTEPFLLLFFAMYLAVSLLYARRRKAEPSAPALEIAGERVDYVDGALVFGTPLAAFGLQYLMVKDTPFGSAFSALGLGLIYLPLAMILYRRGREELRLLVESFLALGVIFASLAIPLGLDAKWTSAAWAAEGAGIFWVGMRQGRPAARAFALLLQFGSAVSLAITLRQPGEPNLLGLTPVLAGSFLGPLFVGLAALFTARMIRHGKAVAREWETALEPPVMVAGLSFLNLALPMVLDQTWTGLALVVSGAATLWLAQRYELKAALGFGALIQVVGGLAFGSEVSGRTGIPIVNILWLGGVLISASGLVSGWRLYRGGGALSRLSVLALAWGLLWWLGVSHSEIETHAARQLALAEDLGLGVLTALLLLVGGRRSQWPTAESAALLLLPAAFVGGLAWLSQKAHPAADGGWLAWPAAIGAMGMILRRLEGRVAAPVLGGSHGFWLLFATGLATWQGWWTFRDLGEPGSAWPILGWALAPMAAIALLNSERLRARWPLSGFAGAYGRAAVPLAAGLWLWVFFANSVSDGSAAPLPYLPIANPIDLATAGALLLLLAWMHRWHGAQEARRLVEALLGVTAFCWLNGVLLRSLHHWAGVPFDFDLMMRSTLVQASLSLFWATIALAVMFFGTRQQLRQFWLLGGGLMAGVVVKLFLVDLSRVGTIERIVSFMGVGILLLVIGYFSPVPPKREERA